MDIYAAVDKAIDEVFKNDRYVLNLYQLATTLRLKRNDMSEFLHSSVAGELKNLVLELDEYLKGGRDSHHQQRLVVWPSTHNASDKYEWDQVFHHSSIHWAGADLP